MNPDSNLSAILKKIQALRARAANAASTEGEAEMAARIAADLLAKHNICLSELDVRAEGVTSESWDSGQQTRPVEAYAGHGIDALCKTTHWYTRGTITVVGAPADVATALYFLDIVRAAVRATWANYQGSESYWGLRDRGKSARAIGFAFRKGVAIRLGERMKLMAEEAATTPTPDGERANALVPVKGGLIRQWMADQNIKLATSPTKLGDISSYSAGRRAAENVGLHHGIGASAPVAALQ